MTWRITIQPSAHCFEADAKSDILEAGLRQGLNLRHGCANGSCGECKARLIAGQVIQGKHQDFRFSEQEKADGYFLMCRYLAASDLIVETGESDQPDLIPKQHIIAKINRIDHLQNDVIQLTIRTPRSQGLQFLAGQSIALRFNDVPSRYLPIANCPCNNTLLRFHVRRQAGDVFNDLMFHQLRRGDPVKLYGPSGDFVLDEESGQPLLMVAWETGFAPIASLIDHAIDKNPERAIYLYWLSQSCQGHYLLNYCDAWRDALDHFQYQAIRLPNEQMKAYQDALGWIIEQRQPCCDCEIYLTSPVAEQQSVRRLLHDSSIPAKQIHITPVEN
jgi:CDP-4-dehydro-6-deoxyglucose reductase